MDGIILVNKEKGMTSHDVVFKLRKILQTKKIGHCGTLDPNATGLLVVGINKGTKIVRFLTNQEKQYISEITLGSATTTEDCWGEVVSEKKVEKIQDTVIDEALIHFLGDYQQIPPMYSAIKYNGKKLYEYARKGIVIEERPVRNLTIYELNRTSNITYNNYDLRFQFQVKGSKGIYIRTLCYDIGAYLGYPAHMSALHRTKSGIFDVKDSTTLEEIQQGKITYLSIKDALQNMKHFTATGKLLERIQYGQMLDVTVFNGKECCLVITDSDIPIAIYEFSEKHQKMKPSVVF